jgi:membrane-associated phospholipid phosphatase
MNQSPHNLVATWATGNYSTMLRRTLTAVTLCGVCVVFTYFFVDRPVAFFVHKHEISKLPGLVWLTYPPPLVQALSPVVLALLVAFLAWKPWQHWQRVLFVACVSLIVADQCRESLGDVCGRYWPETWHNNNPSLIGTDTYGFHPFQHGDDTGSFPSGHAARIAGFAGVSWLAVPRWRWLIVVLTVPMLIALVAMNYHFVSDVIAGGVLGGVVSAYAALLAGVGRIDEVTKAR